jgi:hypothetical protein
LLDHDNTSYHDHDDHHLHHHYDNCPSHGAPTATASNDHCSSNDDHDR